MMRARGSLQQQSSLQQQLIHPGASSTVAQAQLAAGRYRWWVNVLMFLAAVLVLWTRTNQSVAVIPWAKECKWCASPTLRFTHTAPTPPHPTPPRRPTSGTHPSQSADHADAAQVGRGQAVAALRLLLGVCGVDARRRAAL